MMLWWTSGHDVPLETARSDHRFTVASMTSRQAGRMWPELGRRPVYPSGCRNHRFVRTGRAHAPRSVRANNKDRQAGGGKSRKSRGKPGRCGMRVIELSNHPGDMLHDVSLRL